MILLPTSDQRPNADASARADGGLGKSLTWVIVGVVGLIWLLAAAGAWSIEGKAAGDRAFALKAYRTKNEHLGHEAAVRITDKLEQIHQNIRTISLLPSVRELDRHGTNLSEQSLITIQQVYNNLASTVDVSEVYIAPATFDPGRIDPQTGEMEEPTLMFDELIVDAGKRTHHGSESKGEFADAPEVEALEYQVLRKQLDWLEQHHPDMSKLAGLDRPMLSSEEVITCDNRLYIETGKDSDRAGIVLSVPIYGVDGKLNGVVSAIMRTAALAGYLPDADGALVNTAHGYVVHTREDAVPRASADHVMRAEPDPALLFSAASAVNVADPQGEWVFWSGLPNAEFETSPEVRSIEAFRLTAYAILALIVSAMLAAVMIFTTRARAQRARQLKLKRDIAMREEQIAVLERAKAETMEARLAAEEANRAKSQFLANMSHEIRTPLNGVLGIAQALRTEVAAGQQEKIDLILESGRSLTHLLGDILDLSKIEAGKLEIETEPGDFPQSIRRVWELFRSPAEAKGLDYQFRVQADFPRYLNFDDQRVRQCVGNFLSNAIKFTAAGRVVVSLTSKQVADGQHVVAVEVTDSGIGMNAATLARLFKPFTQADNSTTRQYGGTGLGLSISQKLARLMGGDVRARSEQGRGSSFALVLRATEAAAPAPAVVETPEPVRTAPATSLRGLRVLLTDDNALNRRVIGLLLGPSGCVVTEAVNGQEALAILSRQPFDIVLLDAHMPVMDGPETIRAIRASAETWRNIPVIALTADAMAGDREKYLAMGMDDYLTKPVDRSDLLTRMSALLVGATEAVEERRAAS